MEGHPGASLRRWGNAGVVEKSVIRSGSSEGERNEFSGAGKSRWEADCVRS